MMGLDPTLTIEICALIWAGLLLLTLARYDGKHFSTIGLPFAFIASYMSAHVGALVHLVGGYNHLMNPYLRAMNYTRETVADGLEASCLAMVAAGIGFLLVDTIGRKRTTPERPISLILLRRTSLSLMALGSGFLILGVASTRMNLALPGLQAVLSTLQNLLVVGACGFVLHRYLTRGWLNALIWAGILALITPAIRLVTTAILADSVVLAIVIICFFITLPSRQFGELWRRVAVFGLASICAYLFAIFYLQSRETLREIVSGGGSIQQAIGSLGTSVKSFDASTSTDFESLELLDIRMNQNIFIGLAIENLRYSPEDYENGTTIGMAVLAWVPRAVWPTKPERGGSAFLSKHTGLHFSEGTTFGAGPVFEFFVNFGYPGVFFGFVALGTLIRLFDEAAIRALGSADLPMAAQCLLAGIVLLQPLADLFFVVTGLATAFIVGWALHSFWKRRRWTPKVGGRTNGRSQGA